MSDQHGAEKAYLHPVIKYRCVAELVFDEEAKRAAAIQFEKDNGLKAGDAVTILELSAAGRKKTVQEQIGARIRYVFTRPIRPQRFNDTTFDALYTTKEAPTAKKEFEHNCKADLPLGAVIFSVTFVGKALDLRPAVEGKTFLWPTTHSKCRVIGKKARQQSFDAVAAPSARHKGGNCCAIFTESAVRPGDLFERITISKSARPKRKTRSPSPRNRPGSGSKSSTGA